MCALILVTGLAMIVFVLLGPFVLAVKVALVVGVVALHGSLAAAAVRDRRARRRSGASHGLPV